ncbi:MAG: c-type cytochrome [Flavobacteriia bacterium]|nr:c-type cytochrome [Flavobacteriia bacterium]
MKIKPIYIFIILVISYLIYSFTLYYNSFSKVEVKAYSNEKAIEGRLVFQKYNCQDCHQLYGLGGYLGPDLTNVYKKYQQNDVILKAFFKGGMQQMPEFNLTTIEENQLIEFFKMTNSSGSADPRDYQFFPSGMIEQKDKK